MVVCDKCFGDGYVCDENLPANAIAEECPKCKGSGQIEGEYNDTDESE
jgi:DnaJ-class molecular chaperone